MESEHVGQYSRVVLRSKATSLVTTAGVPFPPQYTVTANIETDDSESHSDDKLAVKHLLTATYSPVISYRRASATAVPSFKVSGDPLMVMMKGATRQLTYSTSLATQLLALAGDERATKQRSAELAQTRYQLEQMLKPSELLKLVVDEGGILDTVSDMLQQRTEVGDKTLDQPTNPKVRCVVCARVHVRACKRAWLRSAGVQRLTDAKPTHTQFGLGLGGLKWFLGGTSTQIMHGLGGNNFLFLETDAALEETSLMKETSLMMARAADARSPKLGLMQSVFRCLNAVYLIALHLGLNAALALIENLVVVVGGVIREIGGRGAKEAVATLFEQAKAGSAPELVKQGLRKSTNAALETPLVHAVLAMGGAMQDVVEHVMEFFNSDAIRDKRSRGGMIRDILENIGDAVDRLGGGMHKIFELSAEAFNIATDAFNGEQDPIPEAKHNVVEVLVEAASVSACACMCACVCAPAYAYLTLG